MPDGDSAFEGYVKAKLEDIALVQGQQRLEVQAVRTQDAHRIAVGAAKP